jgi:hypothetical protein
VVLLHSYAMGDLDQRLYASDCTTVLERSESESDQERISHETSAAGTLKVRVVGCEGAENDYDLIVDIQPGMPTATPTPTTRPSPTATLTTEPVHHGLYLPLLLCAFGVGRTPTPTATRAPATATPAATSTRAPGTTPADGQWSGTTSGDRPVSFTVANAGQEWRDFRLSARCSASAPPCRSVSGTIQTTLPGPATITGGHMSGSGSGFSMSGGFTSPTTASGSYVYLNYQVVVTAPYPPYVCIGHFTQTGSWTATAP